MKLATSAEQNCCGTLLESGIHSCGHGLIDLSSHYLSDMTSLFVDSLILSVILYNPTYFALNFSFICDILELLNQRE
jgi:hypothetical protein